MLVLCYPNCSTCQKALAWLDAHDIAYEVRDIKEQNPTEEELRAWQAKSALPLRRFFHTSGLLYKGFGLKETLPSMPEAEQFALLSQHGMLVKRPLVVADDAVLVGFREAEWRAALL